MSDETKTHRCIDCDTSVEHYPKDMCPSCGRCDKHCRQDNHKHMSKVE